MDKIPVRIVRTQDMHGNKKVGVMLDVSYYLGNKNNPEKKVSEFKEMYFDLIKKAKSMREKSLKEKVKNKKQISTRNTWNLCHLLSEFNEKIDNEFLIVNYKEAYARDFGMSVRTVRAFLDFGKHFADNDILDSIPYSTYMEILFQINSLQKLGLFESEKKWLVKMAKGNKIPKRNEYRQHLRQVITDKKSES